jgi:hypothetical protein
MGEWIDSVARAVASGTSRRQALRRIGGGLAAMAVASLLGGETAQAKPACREEGHPCEGNQECCSGLVCLQKGEAGPGNARRCGPPPCSPAGGACAATADCCTGATCVGGACCPTNQVCKGPAGQICCPNGQVCINNGTQCCPSGQVCNDGRRCCLPGLVCVGDVCCEPARLCGSGANLQCCGTPADCLNGQCCIGTVCPGIDASGNAFQVCCPGVSCSHPGTTNPCG